MGTSSSSDEVWRRTTPQTSAPGVDGHFTSYLADADLMREDDFDAFFIGRRRALLGKIATAMGKVIDETAASPDTLEGDDDTDDLWPQCGRSKARVRLSISMTRIPSPIVTSFSNATLSV
ncbi:hypothetical protein K8Z49_07995 [Actinomadura madurae]|uniref:hypothetical protein n=1 Tax=Actinomadura madurae TaxID=1993 RepID=UPI003999A58C